MYDKYAEIRDKMKLKDSDVAKLTGIPKSTFSDWKKGTYTPKIDKMRKIATVLNVPLSELGYQINADELPTLHEDETNKWSISDSMWALSEIEKNLILSFRQLNADGRKNLMNQAQLLLNSPAYQKGETFKVSLDQKEA